MYFLAWIMAEIGNIQRTITCIVVWRGLFLGL